MASERLRYRRRPAVACRAAALLITLGVLCFIYRSPDVDQKHRQNRHLLSVDEPTEEEKDPKEKSAEEKVKEEKATEGPSPEPHENERKHSKEKVTKEHDTQRKDSDDSVTGEKASKGKPSEGEPAEGKPKEEKPSEGKDTEEEKAERKDAEKTIEGEITEGKVTEEKTNEEKIPEGKSPEGKEQEEKTDGGNEDGKGKGAVMKPIFAAILKNKQNSNKKKTVEQLTSTQATTTSNASEASTVEEYCIPPAYHEFPRDLFGQRARARGGVVVHVLVVIYMFYCVAVVCDDYFIASLEECCSRMNLSKDVAGATFMAAGSSAPELFTAILGVLIAKGDVGTGTIVGSAVFNVLFVIGICGIFAGRVVTLTWWPLFRDSIYYAFTVILLIIIIYDSEVTWYESLIMLIFYVIYIIIMKFNSQLHRLVVRLLGFQEEEGPAALGILALNSDKKFYSSYVPFNNEIDNQAAQTPITSRGPLPADESIKHSRRRITFPEACFVIMMTRHFRPIVRFQAAARFVISEHQRQRRRPSTLTAQTSVDPTEMLHYNRARSFSVAMHTEASWKRLPTRADGIWAMIKWVISVPVLCVLHYTIPDCKQNQYRKYFLLTFFASITWTAIFSYVMVWMVTLIGFTMGIPDTIMGITFLAAGTSVPDAFASLVVARQGQGDMAVSNSIGSNVFDILVGLALPWFIQTTMVEPGSISSINSRGMVYAVVLLFLTIIITIAGVHFSNWQLTKRLGISLLFIYAIFLVISTMLEYNVLGYVNPPMCEE